MVADISSTLYMYVRKLDTMPLRNCLYRDWQLGMRGLDGAVGLTLPTVRADRGSHSVYYLP